MNLIIIIISIFWVLAVLKNSIFWLYLWQFKEYRLDRFKAHFELKTSKRIILNKKNGIILLLLIALIIPIGFTQTTAIITTLLLYGLFAFRAIQQFQNKSLKKPKLTFRAHLIVAWVVLFYFSTYIYLFIFQKTWLLPAIVLGDLLTPVIVTAGIFITHPIFQYLKNQIINKAEKKRKKFKDLLVIGITGSYGKSSVKEILYQLLSEKFRVLKTPKNINADIGIARTINKKLNKDHDVFIVEMGAYRKGEIARSAAMVKPQIGIITGINEQHISLFGSLEKIQKAKFELIESLDKKGLAIFNIENGYVKKMAKKYKGPKRTYSARKGEDPNKKIIVQEIKNTQKGLEIKITEDNEETISLKAPLLGVHNATNILGAVTIARELGLSYSQIKKALMKLKAQPHTLNIKRGIKDSIVIDDSYSANTDGVLAALEVLSSIKGGSKICIIQPLIELGTEAEHAHKKIARKIAETCDWCIVTSKDYFPIIHREALENGMSKDNIFSIPEPKDALRKAQELTDKNDVILLENRMSKTLLHGLMLYKDRDMGP